MEKYLQPNTLISTSKLNQARKDLPKFRFSIQKLENMSSTSEKILIFFSF